MSIPSEIEKIIERLNQELEIIERDATFGLNLIRNRLERFPDNQALIQLFATIGNYIVFVEISRRRIDYANIVLLAEVITDEQIQEIGQTLSELLGRVLEAKVIVSNIKNRLNS